jgi:nucleotide-binding universal stress UspA family protein
MIKTILVHLHGDGEDGRLLDLGLATARLFGAHLECLHVLRKTGSIIWNASPFDLVSAGLDGDLTPLEHTDNVWAKRASEAFRAFCSREGLTSSSPPNGPGAVTAAWSEAVGGEQLLRRARFNDLVVERTPSAEAGNDPEWLGRLISGAGRPVLIVPANQPERFLQTVAVAWDDSLEAVRALSAALPLLSKAGRIVLLTAVEAETAAALPAEGDLDALGWLAWHGLNAETRSVPLVGRTPARAVMEAAVQEAASLMVMGGYGHSKAMESVLGGFTREMVDECRLPTFVVH